MRKEARDNIRTYIDVTLVNDFSRINTGLEQVIKNSWQRYESALTDKDRIAYLNLAKETYQIKAQLLDSSVSLPFCFTTSGGSAQQMMIGQVVESAY